MQLNHTKLSAKMGSLCRKILEMIINYIAAHTEGSKLKAIKSITRCMINVLIIFETVRYFEFGQHRPPEQLSIFFRWITRASVSGIESDTRYGKPLSFVAFRITVLRQ